MIHLNQIIKGCLKNDRKAQLKLFTQFNRKLYAVAVRYLKDENEAKEVLQEAWIEIFKGLKSYKEDDKFFAWSKTILIRVAWKHIRKMQPIDELTEQHYQIQPETQFQVMDKLACDEILKLLEYIPITSRTVFKLFVIEEWKHKEISEHLNIKESTSRAHLANARKLLKHYYFSLEKTVRYGVK